MSCGNGGVREVDVTFLFKDKKLRAVAASILMRRCSNGPMATKWNGMDFKRGILWKSLMELLLKVYICCWFNFSNCWFAVWLWSWGIKLALVSSSIAISKEYEFEKLLNDASTVSTCPCAHTPNNWHKLKTILLGKYKITNHPHQTFSQKYHFFPATSCHSE